MIRFASLGSGSKGNATLVASPTCTLLVDCGFSAREATARMRRFGLEPQQLDGILVTHEHTDHSAGVAVLSRKHELPVYLTHGTLASGRLDGGHTYELFNCDQPFTVGDIEVLPVAVPHDAREPCQYRFSSGGRRLGVVTDLGSVTPHVINSFLDCDALLLEFNHDLDMLMAGSYPPALKRRVAGDWGHLNNHQATELLRALDSPRLRHLVVAHISENNNCQALAERALSAVSGALDKTVWATQGGGCDWLQL